MNTIRHPNANKTATHCIQCQFVLADGLSQQNSFLETNQEFALKEISLY